jgi:hypothetical protein
VSVRILPRFFACRPKHLVFGVSDGWVKNQGFVNCAKTDSLRCFRHILFLSRKVGFCMLSKTVSPMGMSSVRLMTKKTWSEGFADKKFTHFAVGISSGKLMGKKTSSEERAIRTRYSKCFPVFRVTFMCVRNRNPVLRFVFNVLYY